LPAATEIRAVVFDLDGTMLNTEDIFEVAGQQLMSRRGLVMTDEIRRAMLGRRPVEAFSALKSLVHLPEPIEDLMRETKELFRALAEHSVAAMPGLHEVLQLTDQLQLPRAVATSSPQNYMQCSRLQIEPAQMLVLEDSETGTRAAAAAGAVVVSVPNRHTATGDFSMASLRISSLLDPQLHSILNARRFHLPAVTPRGF